jgi:DNA-binding protein YbaB
VPIPARGMSNYLSTNVMGGGGAVCRRMEAKVTAMGWAAEGAVEVTVDGRGMVLRTNISESYLDVVDVADLGEQITSAARAAFHDLQARTAAATVPAVTRRRSLLAKSAEMIDEPDLVICDPIRTVC